MEIDEEAAIPFWQMARSGITLLLNNKEDEADLIFKKFPDNIQLYSGFATAAFMDALMSFEEEKLNAATLALKETERRCTGTGWFQSIRVNKNSENVTSFVDHLENKIIKADAEMYLATLTFLQQDISSYFKGGWTLRKSWKNYQHTYNEILSLYKEIVGEPTPDPSLWESIEIVSSTAEVTREDEFTTLTEPMSSQLDEIIDHNELLNNSTLEDMPASSELRELESLPTSPGKITRNGYITKSQTMHFPPQTSQSTNTTSVMLTNNIKKSKSVNTALSRYAQFQMGLSKLSPFNSQLSLSYFSSFNPFNTQGVKTVDIDKQTITRLMCGVSFGYGLLQLGVSFLPPSVGKLGSFLGFQGNRKAGLAKLMYSRSGTDMRAPIATLALLWYHTIVRPFFALDGNNVQAGVQAASKLVDDAMLEYSESSIFLFFKGRVDRLKSDIPAAIEDFNKSLNNSKQREIKVLALHEVGWCYLIQLEYKSALKTFICLKQQSRWSRGFYAYLSTVSAGAAGNLKSLGNLEEFKTDFANCPRGSQLEEFLARRFKICPKDEESLLSESKVFWKLLVYELLYLWNSLPSCNYENLQSIIIDCDEFIGTNKTQPFLGLCELINGTVYCILKDYNAGIDNFRKCLELRKNTTTHACDAHISAFALYELGQLLIKQQDTKLEGKQCLQKVYTYKGYDFEERLSVRVHSILKNL